MIIIQVIYNKNVSQLPMKNKVIETGIDNITDKGLTS